MRQQHTPSLNYCAHIRIRKVVWSMGTVKPVE